MSDGFSNEYSCKSEEEEDFMAGGDLGEGFGRKPGGLYDAPMGHIAQAFKLRKGSDTHGHYQLVKNHGEDTGTTNHQTGKYSVSEDRCIPKHVTEGYTRCRNDSFDACSEVSNEDLRQRLQELTEEVDLLRIELEASQRQRDGKDEALKILQSMAVFDKATSHTKVMLQKAEEQRRSMEKEINVLQWEIEFDQVRLKNLEDSWKEKFDHVCCENAVLKETLELRTNEVKNLKAENSLVHQQCQELLAMLDVKEQKMFQDNISLDKTSFTETTALELAVLGACTCSLRGEPCSCAKMSAATRKQLLQLRQEFELEKKSKEEAYIMADAFRIAFEQQLKRMNNQTLPLSDIERLCKKGSKRLNNWKRLKEDGQLLSRDAKGLGQKLKGMLNSPADCKKLEALDDPQEIFRILIDLLNDKEEALAHQRKVSYMLARSMDGRVEFSKTLDRTSEDDPTTGRQQCNGLDSNQATKSCHSLNNATSHDCLCSNESISPTETPTRSLETKFSSLFNNVSSEDAESRETDIHHGEKSVETGQTSN
ncbi:coiled-coil domain-containing protein 125 isoform 1-T2 [Discoglossus pictus]